MRILAWHGWLLEGSGSNVYAARVADVWRRSGHDVVLLCQQPDPERFDFVDAWGTVSEREVSGLRSTGASAGPGRVVCSARTSGGCCPCSCSTSTRGSR
jgi:hypothetical protein